MATTVKIGGAGATSVTVASATSLTCVVPAGTGTKDVVVTTSAGSATATGGYTYTAPVPAITSVSPSSVRIAANTLVDLIGENFRSGYSTYRLRLTNPGTGATVFGPFSPVSGQITATRIQFDVKIPNTATVGQALTVELRDGTSTSSPIVASLPSGVTLAAAPTFTATSFTPTSAPRSSTLTVNGTGFVSDVRWRVALTGPLNNTLIATRVSDTELTISITGGQTVGAYTVTVSPGTPGDSAYTTVTIPGQLTVT